MNYLFELFLHAVHAPGYSAHQEPAQPTEERWTHRELIRVFRGVAYGARIECLDLFHVGFGPGTNPRAGTTSEGTCVCVCVCVCLDTLVCWAHLSSDSGWEVARLCVWQSALSVNEAYRIEV